MTTLVDVKVNEATKIIHEHQERAVALEAILTHAPDIGLEQALDSFGSALTDTEKEVLKTLTSEEITTLKLILPNLENQRLFNFDVI